MAPAEAAAMVAPTPDVWDAKHERKLLDLEISNKSLLAINAALESTKVKQAKELRELRQQVMRERMEAPDESLSSMDTTLGKLLDPSKLQEKHALAADVVRAFMVQEEELDVLHARCTGAIDTLLHEARAALLAQPDTDAVGRSKVLHPSERMSTDTSAVESGESDASLDATVPGNSTPAHE